MNNPQVAVAASTSTMAGPSTNSLAATSLNDDGDDWTETSDPNPLTFSLGKDIDLKTNCSTVEDSLDLFFQEGF